MVYLLLLFRHPFFSPTRGSPYLATQQKPGIDLNPHLAVHMYGVMERVPMLGVSVCTGQGCRAGPSRSAMGLLLLLPLHTGCSQSGSGLPPITQGQQAEQEPQAGYSSMGAWWVWKEMAGVSLNVPGTIALHFFKQPPVAPESTLNSHSLYSSFCQPNREPS